VRKVWRSLFDANATLMFNPNRDGESLIGKHFDLVEKYNGGSSPDELFVLNYKSVYNRSSG
jgi:hypothetical protein